MIIGVSARSLLRFRFEVRGDGEAIGWVEHRLGRSGIIETGGRSLMVERQTPGRWSVEGDGAMLELTSGAERGYVIRSRDRELQIVRGTLGLRFHLVMDGTEVGTIGPRDLFTRRLVGSAPDDLEHEVVCLVVWAMVRHRRRTVDRRT